MSVTQTSRNYFIYFLVATATVFWGGAFVGGRILAQHGIPPFTAASLRFIIASFVLVPYLLSLEGAKAKLQPADIPLMILLGLSGIFGFNFFFFIGLKYTTAVNGSLIIAANPIVMTMITAVFLRDKINLARIIGIVISFGGVCVVLSNGSMHNLLAMHFNKGDLLMIGAMLSWVTFTLAGRKAMKKYSPVAATTYACVFGMILLLPFMFWELRTFTMTQLGFIDWLIVFYLAIPASVIGFIWWYQGTEILGPSRVSVFLNGNPMSALIITAILGQDQINRTQLIGMSLVVAGVYLAGKQAAAAKSQPANNKAKVPLFSSSH